ncbi:MAG: hypothetical protein O2887_10275 [Bacteroidetes bacterium]|nr:hypothetical protein [Bacteroidota bacterium]
MKFKSLPQGWHDISYSKGLKALEADNEVERLSVLSGVSCEELRASTDIDSIFYFTHAFTFLNSLPEGAFPNSVKFGSERIVFPFVNYSDEFDLGHCSVGQVEDMQGVLVRMNKEFIGEEERVLTEGELLQICPHVVAIYLQGIIEEYDGKKADMLVKRVKDEISFKDCVSMGYFFFKRLSGLMSGQRSRLQKRHSSLRRLRLAFSGLMQRLGCTVQLT